MPAAEGTLAEFAEFVRFEEPLSPYTLLKIGGPAEALAQPTELGQLQKLLARCTEEGIPWRVLGAGGNLLIRDEGVRGLVLRLTAPAFAGIGVEGNRVHAGAGGALSALISATARHGLTGLESFVGLIGTVGGALRNRAGDRFGDLGQRVRQVEILDARGRLLTCGRDELGLELRQGPLDEAILLSADFVLETDAPESILKRMRKAWIQRKASQPFTYQAAVWMFRNPPGLDVSTLVEQAGLAGTRVGGATISERDGNYVVAEAGATSRDVLRLMDLVRTRILDRFQIELETDLTVW